MGSSSSGVKYPADGQPVTPLWVEGVDRSLTDPTAAEVSVPAVSEGRAYVASNRVYAFPLGCALDGSTCDPLWRSELPASPGSSAVLHWSQPAANNGVVFSSSDRPGGVPRRFVCGIVRRLPARLDGAAGRMGQPSGARAVDDGRDLRGRACGGVPAGLTGRRVESSRRSFALGDRTAIHYSKGHAVTDSAATHVDAPVVAAPVRAAGSVGDTLRNPKQQVLRPNPDPAESS